LIAVPRCKPSLHLHRILKPREQFFGRAFTCSAPLVGIIDSVTGRWERWAQIMTKARKTLPVRSELGIRPPAHRRSGQVFLFAREKRHGTASYSMQSGRENTVCPATLNVHEHEGFHPVSLC
jgi:hypothetical protein